MPTIDIPWNISTNYHDCCYQCGRADLVLDEDSLYYNDGNKIRFYKLSCIHYDLCEFLMSRLKKDEEKPSE